MSNNEIPTPDATVEVETKKKRFHLPRPKLPTKTQLRNGALIAAASVGAVLLVQNKTGKTATFEVSTADIVEPDSDQD